MRCTRHRKCASGMFGFANSRDKPFAKRQMQSRNANDTGKMPAWLLSSVRWAGVCLGLGVAFAWFGVYSTSQIPFPERVVYWTGMMTIGVVSSLFFNPLVTEKWLPKAPVAVQIAAISALISVPVTLGLVALEATDGTVQPLPWWGVQYGYAIVISGLLTTAAWGIEQLTQKPAAAPQATSGGGAEAFLQRLPVRLRSAELYAVESEDHYLRVHTSTGQELILMRLADAVRELSGVEGLQTHRSWWVAKQGLADVVKGDGKLTLKLKSGAEAPVSRTYLKTVKEAGWL